VSTGVQVFHADSHVSAEGCVVIQQTAVGAFTWEEPRWISEPIPVPLFGGASEQVQRAKTLQVVQPL
jgi:hypothetical protein